MVGMWAHIYGEGGLAFKSLEKNLCFLLVLDSRYSKSYLKVCTAVLLGSKRAGGNEVSWKGISGLCY